MRKFYLFMLALITSVGAMAAVPELQVSTQGEYHYYTIKNFRSKKFAQWAGDEAQLTQASTLTNACIWYLTQDGDGYKLHNKETAKIYAGISLFTETGATTYIKENPHKVGYWCVSLNVNLTENCWDDQGSQTKIGYYAPKAGDSEGTSWLFIESTGDPDKDMLRDAITEAKKAIGNNPGNYPQSKVDLAEAVFNGTNTSKTYAKALEDLSNAFILPKEGKTYQIISAYPGFKNNQGVEKALYAKSDSTFRWNTVSITNKDYFWTFTKDGSNYKIQNLGKAGKYISDAGKLADTGASIELISVGEGQFNIHGPKGNFHTNNHSRGAGVESDVINYGYGLSNASAWKIVEAEPKTAAVITYQVKDGETLLWSQEVDAAVGAPYPAPSFLSNFVTFNVPDGNVAETEETKVITYDTSFPFQYSADVEHAKYYAMDIHGNEAKYPMYNDGGNLRVEFVAQTNADEYTLGGVKSDNYMWALIGDPFKGFKLYNRGAEKYAVQTNDADEEITLGDAGTVFQVYNTTSGLANSFALKVPSRSNYFNHRKTKVQGWIEADGGSSIRVWDINGAEVAYETTLGAEYGTLVLPFYSEIPGGLELYTCSAVDNNNILTLTPATGLVKANTAYIIKGTEGQTYNFTNTSKNNGTEDVTTGRLTGKLVAGTVPVGSYILAKKDRLGFYRVAEGANMPAAANKCYLTLPVDNPSVKAFYFEGSGIETAIENVMGAQENGAIYDLQGRRVEKAVKGIYIVNGKKVVF